MQGLAQFGSDRAQNFGAQAAKLAVGALVDFGEMGTDHEQLARRGAGREHGAAQSAEYKGAPDRVGKEAVGGHDNSLGRPLHDTPGAV